MALLSPAELQRLEQLALRTRTRLPGIMAGDHRARRFGSSMDFADHREYTPGDDFRRIDIALSARIGRPFLRLFEAEEDLRVTIIVDASASMTYGDPPKLTFAARLAAALGHVALVRHDRVRFIGARGPLARSRWHTGRADSAEAMRWLGALEGEGPDGTIDAVRRAREGAGPGVTFLIGDLLDPSWERAVRALGPPGEATVIHVLAPDELVPPLQGDLTLVDAETGAEVALSVDARTLRAYRERVDAWRAEVRSACGARGVGYSFARSDEDAVVLVTGALRTAGVVR